MITTDPDELREIAARVRRHVVEMCAQPAGGHLGGSLSVVDILVTLYFGVLRIDPDDRTDPDRDVFLLSKGHAALALYATLAERGFLDPAELQTFGGTDSRLMAHPVRAVPGVEMPTGSLGHGLALGIGFALAARADGRASRSYVVLGDGELQEGSVWEAAMVAAALRLSGLTAIVDRNGLQQSGATETKNPLEPLSERWRSFGWQVETVDGHDVDALLTALPAAGDGRPRVIIADTVKGRGVSRAEGNPQSHFAVLSPRHRAAALRDLGAIGAHRSGEGDR